MNENIIMITLGAICLILLFSLISTKSALNKERKTNGFAKENLQESEIVIRKLQTQLQRNLDNINLITEEFNKVKNDAVALRTRNSQYRMDNDRLRSRISELESKIEALL